MVDKSCLIHKNLRHDYYVEEITNNASHQNKLTSNSNSRLGKARQGSNNEKFEINIINLLSKIPPNEHSTLI
jgi:hypothetical protein